MLRLLAVGRSTASIAEELFLSTHTVRNHISSILSKLGAHSKLEAVAVAARDGLISFEGTRHERRSLQPQRRLRAKHRFSGLSSLIPVESKRQIDRRP